MRRQSVLNTVRVLSNGVFAVNKQKGLTSAQTLESIKELVLSQISSKVLPQPLKFGHGGTLDNTATGLLVIGCGNGCKDLTRLLHGNKRYIVSGHLGIATDTFNETGSVTGRASYDHVSHEMINEKLKQFRGRILQIPPKYSALKLGGRRLGDLTRDGIDFQVNPRPVICHSVHCFEFSPPIFKLSVSCGGGFYVRSLVDDLGRALDTFAHVSELQRIQQGPFTEEDMLDAENWTLENIIIAIERIKKKYSFVCRQNRHKSIQEWDYR